jgi:hypothetical protein
MSKRPIESIFEEIGAKSPEEVSLDKVKPDRRELDKIVMGEILGLSEKEQLEVYKAVIDLVKSRTEKAQSVSRQKVRSGVDIMVLAEEVWKELPEKLSIFPDSYVSTIDCDEVKIEEGSIDEIDRDLHGNFIKIDGKKKYFDNVYELRFYQYCMMNRKQTALKPRKQSDLETIVKEYEKKLNKFRTELTERIKGSTSDKKLRKQLEAEVWKKIYSGTK